MAGRLNHVKVQKHRDRVTVLAFAKDARGRKYLLDGVALLPAEYTAARDSGAVSRMVELLAPQRRQAQ